MVSGLAKLINVLCGADYLILKGTKVSGFTRMKTYPAKARTNNTDTDTKTIFFMDKPV